MGERFDGAEISVRGMITMAIVVLIVFAALCGINGCASTDLNKYSQMATGAAVQGLLTYDLTKDATAAQKAIYWSNYLNGIVAQSTGQPALPPILPPIEPPVPPVVVTPGFVPSTTDMATPPSPVPTSQAPPDGGARL